ncbi:MAG: hypothetical protein PVJ76_13730 [Gemmatimonadota bacterium]|jgi:hypothetical protein
MRSFFFWGSAALLLFLGLSGVQSFFSDWPLASNPGQRLCTVGQGVFGISGLLAGLGSTFKKRWAAPFALVFAVSAGGTAGLATVVWAGSGLGAGIGSGALGLLLGILLYLGVSGCPPGSKEGPTKDPEEA